jgi:hypothetical protein
MNRAYWHQRATPWVSYTVLAGGLVTAILLVFIYRVQSSSQFLATPTFEEIASVGTN